MLGLSIPEGQSVAEVTVCMRVCAGVCVSVMDCKTTY